MRNISSALGTGCIGLVTTPDSSQLATLVFNSVNSNLLWVDIIAAITRRHESVHRVLRVRQEVPDFMTASGSTL